MEQLQDPQGESDETTPQGTDATLEWICTAPYPFTVGSSYVGRLESAQLVINDGRRTKAACRNGGGIRFDCTVRPTLSKTESRLV
jgi:hypothetical protein